MTNEQTINDFLETEEFYDVMIAYRTMPRLEQKYVVEAFEQVKEFIRKHLPKEKEENKEIELEPMYE